MDTQLAGNRTTHCRRPLQPINTPANLSSELSPKPCSFRKVSPFKLAKVEPAGEVNSEIAAALPTSPMASGDLLLPAETLSLAEELGAARRLKERLRSEREKTETMLRDRDLVLEKEAREAERRELEHTEVEVKLQSLLRLIELRSLLVSPFNSSPLSPLLCCRGAEKKGKKIEFWLHISARFCSFQ